MRRGNGDGSIFKLSGKRRKPWAVRITTGWTDEGKQITKYLGYYKTKTEAKAALNQYIVSPYELETKSVTLWQVYEGWEKETTISEKTKKNYISAFNRAENLYKTPMRDIKVMHLERVLEQLSPHMKKVFRNMMKQLYIYAMKHEIVDKNIMELITVKEAEVKERVPFTVEEIERLKAYKHKHTDTAIILLYTGMRITELLEIKTENVNLAERYMKGGIKTEAGKDRIIPIHDEIFELVKARFERGHKLLICHDNGKPIPYRSYRSVFWDRMSTRLKLEHTPHDTRHTFATFADRVGMNKVALKRMLGHSLKDVTDHYTHKDISELLEEINKLEYK